jgi:two-component system capsular synthesis response regulator RcsB
MTVMTKIHQLESHAEVDMLHLGRVLFMEPCLMSLAGIRRVFALHAFHIEHYLGAVAIRDLPRTIAKNSVDLIIMALDGDGESVFEGLHMIRYLRRIRPLTPLFISTSLADPRILQQLKAMAVSGIYLKQDPLSDLVQCVLQGMGRGRAKGMGLSSQAALLLEGRAAPLLLSEREFSVLGCLFAGNSVTKAALLLKRDIRTISTQKRSAMNKWGFHDDGELYIWGRGLVQQRQDCATEDYYEYLVSDIHIAISTKSPLTRYGILNFIQEAYSADKCDMDKSPVRRKLPVSTTALTVVELDGTDTAMRNHALQLLALCHQNPHMALVVYTDCMDVTILSLLNNHQKISLIAKRDTMEQVHQDFRILLAGCRICSPNIEQRFNSTGVLQPPVSPALTRAEHDVLQHLFAGISLTKIAELTCRSIKTVSAHKCSSMRKLGVRNNAELFQLSINNGLLLRERKLGHTRLEITES